MARMRSSGSASPLAKLSRLQLLTIDQTSTRSYEAADIDTVGQRVAKQFAVNVPSVLVSREGGGAWSYRPGLYDVSVLLPAAPAGEAQRPDWLSLGGKRWAVDIDLLDHLIIGQGHWHSLRRLGLGFPKG